MDGWMRWMRRMDDRTNARARETETETDAERGKIEEKKQGIGTDANGVSIDGRIGRNRNRNRNPIIRVRWCLESIVSRSLAQQRRQRATRARK